MSLFYSSSILILTSIIIFYVSNIFAKSSSKIGDYLKLPRSVKGATFDAIASSLPELFVSLFSVVFFMKFEVGIGTIAGSALFNLLVIPGICVLMSPIKFKVSKEVINRDALYYLMSVFILLVITIYFKTWGIIVALILLLVYFLYIKEIRSNSISYQKKLKKKKEKKELQINIKKEILISLITVLVIGLSTYFLTKASIDLSYIFNIPAIIIAFTITAAATSLPDAIISISNAKRGDIDDATSNVFGSNIFDISVGLGLPLLIYSIFRGSIEINFENLGIILGLLGSTIIILYFFLKRNTLTKKQGLSLLILYALFVLYVILLSLGILPA